MGESYKVTGLALAAMLAASPALTATELLGGGILVPQGTGCTEFGWTGPQPVVARLAPQGAPGNPARETQMALLLGTGTIAMRFNYNGGNPMAAPQAITSATYVWNGPWTPEEPSMTLSWHRYGIGFTRRTTEMQEWVIYFQNFNEHQGCQMMAVLSLRIN